MENVLLVRCLLDHVPSYRNKKLKVHVKVDSITVKAVLLIRVR